VFVVAVCCNELSKLPLDTEEDHKKPYSKYSANNSNKGQPGSSVSIMSGYGLDERAIEVRSSAEVKGFFL
jgi:hypothetical protein